MDDDARPSWTSRTWIAAAGVLAVLVFALLSLGRESSYLITALCLIAAAAVATTGWALARTRAQRQAYEEQLTAWAAQRAAQAERTRIARDLHDLASHGIGLITVRAATANLAGDDDDAERRQALADVEGLGRQTMSELRRMLTLLRSDGDPAPLRPTDSFAALPGIIEGARRAGLSVTTECASLDDLGQVAGGVQLSVCATVREALTNAAQHAGPTTAHLSITRQGASITVDVRDAGPMPGWRAHPGTGHGLRGLRERLALDGGTLAAGPFQGGFRLLAQIPAPRP